MLGGGRVQSGAERSVGIADMTLVKDSGQTIVTHALGSCIGVTIYDPVAKVGGLLHFMLDRPMKTTRSADHPAEMYASTGIPELFKQAYKLGATKDNLIVAAAGAAEMIDGGAGMRIGTRNRMILRKIFWKNGIKLAAEDTGGSDARALRLNMETGIVTVNSRNQERLLWKP
ncbi:MAG: chemotaxis protein CheD [Planctomycetota bacterium]|jgi:chemotaxis protein CheD